MMTDYYIAADLQPERPINVLIAGTLNSVSFDLSKE